MAQERSAQQKSKITKKCNTGTHLLIHTQFSVYCLSAEQLACFLDLNTYTEKKTEWERTCLSEIPLFCRFFPPEGLNSSNIKFLSCNPVAT